jgi:hypothetical protein
MDAVVDISDGDVGAGRDAWLWPNYVTRTK